MVWTLHVLNLVSIAGTDCNPVDYAGTEAGDLIVEPNKAF